LLPQPNLDLTWERLTNIEKQTLLKISQNAQPLSREEIKKLLSLSSLEIINSIQSLTRRYLLTKSENDEKLFHISSVLRWNYHTIRK
jgi:predicted transcriptional regulator